MRKWELLRTCPCCSVSYPYPFPTGLFFIPNCLNEFTQMLRRNACTSSLSASHGVRWESLQIECRSSANSQNAKFCAVMLRPITSTDKTYVGCKYTNFILRVEFSRHYLSLIGCMWSVKTLLVSVGVSQVCSPYLAQLCCYSFVSIRI